MGYSVPDAVKGGGKSKKGFSQASPANSKWKRYNNSNRGNHPGQRHNPVKFPPSAFVINVQQQTTPKVRSVGFKNRFKRRRLLAKRRLYSSPSAAPRAPRNTTSFIIRAKRLGGIAPPITPFPPTPAVIPTPALSPGLRCMGFFEDMNKELGVNGYGSMNGLIRLRAYDDRTRVISESNIEVDEGEQAVEDPSIHRSVERLEQRIDQGLSRFEIIYPSGSDGVGTPRNLEDCVDNQEFIIANLEEENLTLKERLFLVEREVNALRRKVNELEGKLGADEPMEENFQESCGDTSVPCN